MLDSLNKIPKGVNLIIFIWALVGLFLLLRDRGVRKEKLFYISLGMIGFMIFWRALIETISSRYVLGLILPFTGLAAYLLFDVMTKRRHLLVRLALCTAIIISGYIFLRMNLDSSFRNYSSTVISEIFADMEKEDVRGNYKFSAGWRDFSRVFFTSRLNGRITPVKDILVHDYVVDYRNVYPDTFFNMESRMLDDDPVAMDRLRPHMLASLIEDTRKHKKQYIFFLSNGNQCVTISENRIPPYRPNLLENGDFEVLDSQEESYAKFKSNIENYALSQDVDESIRTPRGAYFCTASDLSLPPDVNTQESGAIAGKYSVRIQSRTTSPRSKYSIDFIPRGTDITSLMFDRRFSNGEYDYSMLVKGKKGTQVRILYEAWKNGIRETVPLGIFTIPDKRLFQITTRFSVDGLEQGDYFQVGVSVQNGEAYLDNFSLTQSESAVPAASDANPD